MIQQESDHSEYIKSYLDLNIQVKPSTPDQHFYGHGKLLLSGEYFVLDGAEGLAIPTKAGQALTVKYQSSFSPKLYWSAKNVDGQEWFSGEFEFWRFNILETNDEETALFVQSLLRSARKQNNHFLREEIEVRVETNLGFPLSWGLGSSSTLIHNVAHWAYISPFKLAFDCMPCSGYDIACAQSEGPILYKKNSDGPNWSMVNFAPSFKDNLYFLYLGKKQNTLSALEHYRTKKAPSAKVVNQVTALTRSMLNCQEISQFQQLMQEHEEIVSKKLGLPKIKDALFADFDGAVKSLGAWGGDFCMAVSDVPEAKVREYFSLKGFNALLKFDDLALASTIGQNGLSSYH